MLAQPASTSKAIAAAIRITWKGVEDAAQDWRDETVVEAVAGGVGAREPKAPGLGLGDRSLQCLDFDHPTRLRRCKGFGLESDLLL